jgi:hypothetical protein
MNREVNCGISRKWGIIQHYKEMNDQAMKDMEKSNAAKYL